MTQPQRFPELGPAAHRNSGTSSRLLIGGAAAIAAVVASRRSSNRWAEEVDIAAQAIGQTSPLPGWRWWRLARNHLT